MRFVQASRGQAACHLNDGAHLPAIWEARGITTALRQQFAMRLFANLHVVGAAHIEASAIFRKEAVNGQVKQAVQANKPRHAQTI
jgi:hypothetical protein